MSGKEEWTVFTEMSFMELARVQHVYVWEEERTAFIEMLLLGKGLYTARLRL